MQGTSARLWIWQFARTVLDFRYSTLSTTRSPLHCPTREFLAKYCAGVPVRREMDEFEAPLSNRKAREILGFKEEHDWRKYVPLN